MEKPDHEYFMKQALKQAEMALVKGEVPVGVVIVHKSKVIAKAHNQCEMLHDPTAHAEMIAITQAAETLSHEKEGHRGSLEGATMYVTLEPCPMCAGALVMTKCSGLVYGTKDPKTGACNSLYNITQDDRLNHRLNVVSGVMETDAKNLLQEFFKKLRKDKR